jgi:hypothetical protein
LKGVKQVVGMASKWVDDSDAPTVVMSVDGRVLNLVVRKVALKAD